MTKEEASALVQGIKNGLKYYNPESPTSSSTKGFEILFTELSKGAAASEGDFPLTIYNTEYQTKEEFTTAISNNLVMRMFAEIIGDVVYLKFQSIIEDIYDQIYPPV